MPASPKVRFTYEDYLATSEDPSRRHEVIDGELFVTAAPRWRHQRVGARLVEVLSPSNRSYDRGLKRMRYLASGVPELWIVDADEGTLEVWRPGATEPEWPKDVVTWRVGGHAFDIPLAEIFRPT